MSATTGSVTSDGYMYSTPIDALRLDFDTFTRAFTSTEPTQYKANRYEITIAEVSEAAFGVM